NDKTIQALELFEGFPGAVVIIAAWHTGNTFIVHRPEDKVCANECNKEVDVAKCIIHHTAKHLRKPVIDAGKHTEEGRYTHYYMEVGDHEVCIVQMDIQC